MSIDWLPEVRYSHYVLRPSAPCRPWTPASRGVGGSETSAAGVPSAYQIRRDRLMRVTIRFNEWEWPQVDAWIEWAQSTGGVFAVRLDRDRPETERRFYLDAPEMGEIVEPYRSDEYPAVMEIDVDLRYAD